MTNEKTLNKRYYFEFDIPGVGGSGNHIAEKVQILWSDGSWGWAGILLCNNAVAFLTSEPPRFVETLHWLGNEVCSTCIKEYEDDA